MWLLASCIPRSFLHRLILVTWTRVLFASLFHWISKPALAPSHCIISLSVDPTLKIYRKLFLATAISQSALSSSCAPCSIRLMLIGHREGLSKCILQLHSVGRKRKGFWQGDYTALTPCRWKRKICHISSIERPWFLFEAEFTKFNVNRPFSHIYIIAKISSRSSFEISGNDKFLLATIR